MTINHFGSTSLRDVARLRNFKRRRESSYDRTGANIDFFHIKPGEKKIIFDVDGPGCINHIWTTQLALGAKFWPRHVIIRMWWDDEEEPSVECPLGDFFGLGHGERINFISEPLQMSPAGGKGFNCWWPMPFKKHARIEIENDNPSSKCIDPEKRAIGPGMMFYYYVDYELYDDWPDDPEAPIGYLHAQFRTKDYKDMWNDPDTGKRMGIVHWLVGGGHNTRENGGYDRNHVILEAKGKGQYVGCNLNIYNPYRPYMPIQNWPGEGDDMIWIDDDIGGEPTLYGTGTEDYVNTAFCPQEKHSAPYHGIIKGGRYNWVGKITYYRYHIQDPISFQKEIKVSIEHGHDNHRGGNWTTTAYWYQLEPHDKFPQIPSREERMPHPKRIILKLSYKGLKIVGKAILYLIALYIGILILQYFKLI
ncbi:MAG: glycoside hydrolase family 172 protein [Candidatus Hodarchaeota archaeon]